MKCPQCNSERVKKVKYMDVDCVVCEKCGFDESAELDVSPEYDSSQKAKGNYNKYKTGGSRRTQK
jgi:Zn ribbon nucleic-acid-binding protein